MANCLRIINQINERVKCKAIYRAREILVAHPPALVGVHILGPAPDEVSDKISRVGWRCLLHLVHDGLDHISDSADIVLLQTPRILAADILELVYIGIPVQSSVRKTD